MIWVEGRWAILMRIGLRLMDDDFLECVAIVIFIVEFVWDIRGLLHDLEWYCLFRDG